MVHNSSQDLKNIHHHGILGDRVGPFEPAGGDGGDDGVNGVFGPWSLLVEDSKLKNLQCGGESDAGGGGVNFVALDDV